MNLKKYKQFCKDVKQVLGKDYVATVIDERIKEINFYITFKIDKDSCMTYEFPYNRKDNELNCWSYEQDMLDNTEGLIEAFEKYIGKEVKKYD